jgi:hypothetical protein
MGKFKMNGNVSKRKATIGSLSGRTASDAWHNDCP